MTAETSDRIPWAEPVFWGREEALALDALRSSWISGGPYVDRFESEFASYAGSRNVLAVSNGTAALHLAFLSTGIGAGDEIIVPGFAFMAAANMARMVGATPVFADVDPETWCITATSVEPLISKRTRAIVPVHTYGNACELDPLLELGHQRGIVVIEDAAESIGTKYGGRMTGSLGLIGTYSFHATKTITTGEGGAVATSDDALAERMRLYRSHGMGRTRYLHEVAGHNFRLTNLQAAIGCGQLEQIDIIVQRRRDVWQYFTERLRAISGVSMQKIESQVDPVMWAVGIRLDPQRFPQGRDLLMRQMEQLGIETRPGFYPATAMQHIYGQVPSLPVSQALAASLLVLPSSPSLDETRIERICTALSFLAR